MDNLAWDFLGKTLAGIILYVIVVIACAAIFFPLAIIPTVIAIWWIIKETK